MVTQWTDEESGITIYIHTAFANSEDGTVDFTLEPEEPEEGEDAPVYLYTGQYEDDEDPTESEDPEDYIWTYTGYDPAQEPDTSEAGDIEEPVELDPLVEAGLPEEAARMIRENRTDFEGNQDATDQTITNPNELVGTNHGASGYTVTSGLTAAAISDPVYAEGESAIRCCRITCQTAGANASVSFGADELEQKILDALDTLEENSVFTYTLSFDVRMSNPAVTGDITLGDLLTFPAFDPDDYIIGEDDPEPDDEGAEEEAAAGDEEATPDPDGSEVDDEADDQAGPVDITDIWVHYSATADVDQSGTAGAALTIPVTMASGDTLDIVNLKIEAGAMATAWKVSAIEAEAAARAAQAAADAAMEMAQATNKHFFYANSTGAHITTMENAPNSGNNVLIDSNGIYVREDTNALAEFTNTGTIIRNNQTIDNVAIYTDDTSGGNVVGEGIGRLRLITDDTDVADGNPCGVAIEMDNVGVSVHSVTRDSTETSPDGKYIPDAYFLYLTDGAVISHTRTEIHDDLIVSGHLYGANGIIPEGVNAPITLSAAGKIGISAATESASGSMSASDKTKLNKISVGADGATLGDSTTTALAIWGNSTNKVAISATNSSSGDGHRYAIRAQSDGIQLYDYTDSAAEYKIYPTSGTAPISVSDGAVSHDTSGVTAGTKGTNNTTALTPAFGGTFNVIGLAVNATGHITSANSHTVKIPNTAASSDAAGLMPSADKTFVDARKMYYQTNNSAAISLSAGTITKVTLTTTNRIYHGSNWAISSGGVKVTNAGRYRISGSVSINSASGQTTRSAYVYKGTSATITSNTQICEAQYAGAASGPIAISPKIVELAANDIVFLGARSQGAASSCPASQAGTYLLIERLS
ncbi:MAG: hypothetical protein K5707_04140 [Clostridia bacterium]|nr:hypothetical protein [Clostridia bacterium]